MEHSKELKDLIKKNAHLFWYSKETEKEHLPLPVVVEFFLNYAPQTEVKQLFKIVGIKKVADLFFNEINLSDRSANNFFPVIKNFFTLYFKRYAQ